MIKNELLSFATNKLKDILDQSGSILYSSHETLKENDFFLLGTNPGGNSNTKETETLHYNIKDMLVRTENAYIEQDWHHIKKYTKSNLQNNHVKLIHI